MTSYVTIQEAARILGVTPHMVQQMITQGLIPKPNLLGERDELLNRSDVIAARNSPSTSGVVAWMPPPPAPLKLIRDEVFQYKDQWINSHPVHLRVYQGDDRTVALMSEPIQGSGSHILHNHFEHVAEQVLRESLKNIRGDQVTWIHIHDDSLFSLFPKQQTCIRNVILQRVLKENSANSVQWNELQWPRITWDNLYSVLGGAAVDIYDWSHYSPEIIAHWQKSNSPLEVHDDPQGLRPFCEALTYFITTLDVDENLKNIAQAALAFAIYERTPDPSWTGYAEDHEAPAEPTVTTTHSVPYNIPSALLPFLQEHTYENLPQYAEAEANYELLIEVEESVDQYADHPNHKVFGMIHLAIEAQVKHVLLNAHPETNPPARKPKNRVRTISPPAPGKWGQEYVSRIAWEPQVTIKARDKRRLGEDYKVNSATTKFGQDLEGNSVMMSDYERGGKLLRILWPTAYSNDFSVEGVHIVADGNESEKFAFLSRGGILVGILPWDSGRQWNFGYGGSGPGALSRDVRKFLCDCGIEINDRVRDWIEQKIFESPADHLDINLENLN